MQRAERFLFKSDAFGRRLHREIGGHLLRRDVPKTRAIEGVLDDAGLAEAEGAGLTSQGRRQRGPTANDRDWTGKERVLVCCRVDDRADPFPRAKSTTHRRERFLLVWKIDQSDPRNDGVERIVLDWHLFAIGDQRLD